MILVQSSRDLSRWELLCAITGDFSSVRRETKASELHSCCVPQIRGKHLLQILINSFDVRSFCYPLQEHLKVGFQFCLENSMQHTIKKSMKVDITLM